ncbi:MAG: hypothetical protein M1825_001293 [Sarcosagium campestre]|nr:MAG: hypothetical protein M1825_001293 [Sarcosagium campestre]
MALGLLPPYRELWKRGGEVVGINFIFLGIDFMGAFFSLMALVAQNTFDALGGSLYIVCLALEIGIFASHWIFLFRTRGIRCRAIRDNEHAVGNGTSNTVQQGEVLTQSMVPDVESGTIGKHDEKCPDFALEKVNLAHEDSELD